jgi:hypothetical protein
LNSPPDNVYIMGIELRRTIKEGDCTCFIFPIKKNGKDVHLCFHKGILGAMSDDQEKHYCTPRSFVPKQEGGIAQDIRSDKVQAMVAAMKGFGEASHNARSKYRAEVEEDGERDMDRWRETVGREASIRAPKREALRKLTKAERKEARGSMDAAIMDRAAAIEERQLARKNKRTTEEWDSARLGDYG